MTEHPLYRMWKGRLEVERARETERAQRKAARERELASWYEAWRAYKAQSAKAYEAQPAPRWWDVLGWARWLLRLHV